MMRSIHVQANPSIFGLIIPGDGVPEWRQGPTLGAYGQTKPDGGQPAIDADRGCFPAPDGNEFGNSQPSRADCGRGKVGYRKHRRKIAASGDLQVVEKVRTATRRSP